MKRSGQRHFRWPSGTEIPLLVRTQNDQWRVTDGQKVQAFAEAGTEKKPLCMNGFSLNSGGSGVSSSLSMKMEKFFWGYPPRCPLGCSAWLLRPIDSVDAGFNRLQTSVSPLSSETDIPSGIASKVRVDISF